MKKVTAAVLAACLCLGMTACSAKDEQKPEATQPLGVQETRSAQEPVLAQEAQPVQEAQPIQDENAEFTYIGRWKLDMDRIDTEGFFNTFGTSTHEGAQMNITEDGRVKFWIGATGGYGKYMSIEAGFVAKVTTWNESRTENYIFQPDGEAGVILMNIDSVELFWVPDENAQSDMENELMEKLVDISQNVQLGTAGSRMQAIKIAAELMDWGSYVPMSKEAVFKVVADCMKVKESNLDEFVMQIVAVEDAYRTLLTEGQEDMLESAGVEHSGYPWDGEIPVVENIFSAAYAD